MAEEVLKAPGDARRRRYVATSRRTAVRKACGALHALFSAASEDVIPSPVCCNYQQNQLHTMKFRQQYRQTLQIQ
jgi:hypothetical protein